LFQYISGTAFVFKLLAESDWRQLIRQKPLTAVAQLFQCSLLFYKQRLIRVITRFDVGKTLDFRANAALNA
jgi:hypothetical protein